MKLRTRSNAVVAALIAMMVGLTACGTSSKGAADPPKTVNLEASDAGRTVSLRPSDTLVVTLESNASTGFAWALTGKPDAALLELVSSDYVAPTATATPMLVGAPGEEVWRFRATGEGSTTLELTYRRASGETAGQPFRVTVQVASGG